MTTQNEVYDELKEDVNLGYEKKIDLKEDEYKKLKTDTLDSIKNYLNKIKYILIIFSDSCLYIHFHYYP